MNKKILFSSSRNNVGAVQVHYPSEPLRYYNPFALLYYYAIITEAVSVYRLNSYRTCKRVTSLIYRVQL